MSLLNLASFVSSNLGAFMTHLLEVNEVDPALARSKTTSQISQDFHNLSLLIFLCNVSGLLPLVRFRVLPSLQG